MKGIFVSSQAEISRATMTIENSLGLHLRPASQLVQVANRYPDCEVRVRKDGTTVDGKSIMGVIMLAAEQGSDITFEVWGDSRELDDELEHLGRLKEQGLITEEEFEAKKKQLS